MGIVRDFAEAVKAEGNGKYAEERGCLTAPRGCATRAVHLSPKYKVKLRAVVRLQPQFMYLSINRSRSHNHDQRTNLRLSEYLLEHQTASHAV